MPDRKTPLSRGPRPSKKERQLEMEQGCHGKWYLLNAFDASCLLAGVLCGLTFLYGKLTEPWACSLRCSL